MTYKITFTMESPICFIDRPIFDGILLYCWIQNKHPQVKGMNLRDDQIQPYFEGCPIVVTEGIYKSSIMYFDESIGSVDSWKKRWDNKNDCLTNSSRINTGQGIYRSYSVPMKIESIGKVWFYFDSEDCETVHSLIENELAGIGKKVSQGKGFFSSFEIEEESQINFQNTLIRPIPLSHRLSKNYSNEHKRYCGWKPGYWVSDNMDVCIVPEEFL